MSLIFGAIIPHPPVLIPTIGQENLAKLKKTEKALKELEDTLYHLKPDTIIIISPHGQLIDDAFTINHLPVLKGDFEEFGDLSTKLEFKNNLGLAYRIRESMETQLPIVLTSEEKLDHGSLVPLYYLTAHLKDITVIPIHYSMLDRGRHFQFGQEIRKILEQTSNRVVVIASGDLSHRLTKKAPGGFSPRGKEFDQQLIKLLKEKKINEILNLDENLVAEAGECGLRSILILLGIFSELNYQFKVLSYQSPFGVGYLVASFYLN